MKNKEELALMWIIVGATGIVTTILYPPILLIGIFMYAAISLYKHYKI
jgi:fumarate reductase subunit D|tara:strand:- start:6172 stop:6315 length:144 start_codon:yes stop_codon:yes gene_type:complete